MTSWKRVPSTKTVALDSVIGFSIVLMSVLIALERTPSYMSGCTKTIAAPLSIAFRT